MNAVRLVILILQLIYAKAVVESAIRKCPMPESIPLRTGLCVKLQSIILRVCQSGKYYFRIPQKENYLHYNLAQ